MGFPNDFKISPKYFASDWKRLNLTKPNNSDWNRAITIFNDRINGRFIKQIKVLESNPDSAIREFSGFTIVSLDCLLIETLQQFYKGIESTKQGKGSEIFHDFFSRSSMLAKFFNTRERSKIFYEQVRCGLLHQGQTRRKSTIHSKKDKNALEWVDEKKISEGITINRKKFHKEIVIIYKAYLKSLENGDSTLRANLASKMNKIVNLC